jgi:hypothetical protein
MPVPLTMKVGPLSVALASDKKLFDDTQIVKTITAVVDSVEFVGLHSTVSGVDVEIVKTVNNAGDYVDSESLRASVSEVAMAHVQPLFLAWLCCLQDASNNIPSSRFAHPKSSALLVSMAALHLGVDSSALNDSPVNVNGSGSGSGRGTASTSATTTSSTSTSTTTTGGAAHGAAHGEARSCLPQVSPSMVFSLQDVVVSMAKAERSSLGVFEIQVAAVGVEVMYLAMHLRDKYSIDCHPPMHDYTNACGVIFGFLNTFVKFELDKDLDIKHFAADLFTLSHSGGPEATNVHWDTAEAEGSAECARDKERLFGKCSPYLTCVELLVTCPRPEQYDICMSSLRGTAGLMTYLRFQYGLAQVRAFVSRSVDVLGVIKDGGKLPFLFNPRHPHTVADIADPRAWLPPPPPAPPRPPAAKPADAYMKVTIATADVSIVLAAGGEGGEGEGEGEGGEGGDTGGKGGADGFETQSREKLVLEVRMEAFCYHSFSPDSTIVEWSLLNCFSSRWASEAFLAFGATSVAMVERAADEQPSSTAVDSVGLTLTLNAKMCLGVLLDAALQQRDLMRIATAEASGGSGSGSGSGKSVLAARSKARKKILSVKFKDGFYLNFDCVFEKQDVRKFCVVEFLGLQLTVRSSDDTEYDEGRVRELDGWEAAGDGAGRGRPLRYGGFSGGDLSMSARIFRVSLAPEPDDYILASALGYSGPLYLAQVLDHRAGVSVRRALLSDDVRLPVSRFSAELGGSSAPSKVYTRLAQTCSAFTLILHPAMPLYLDAINRTLTASMPPNTDPTPPLMWWDSYRYWMHGAMLLKFEEFKVVYTVTGAARSVLNLHILMSDTKLTGIVR